MSTSPNSASATGRFLIAGAVLLFIPYTILTITFDYPDILRQDSGLILTRFQAGGASLIWTWLAFALVGLPLIPAYSRLGQWLETNSGVDTPNVRWATSIGVVGLVVQMVGLLRWTFVVPVLARTFVAATNQVTREACRIAFITIHQYGGVVLGEHLGQLFTIIWTVVLTGTLGRAGVLKRGWVVLGYGSSAIYLLAQAELLATVLPGLPVWGLAGFLGSTLWLVWLIGVGVVLMRKRPVGVEQE
ncbi:DUF4386 domain-containing protein [uncultured Fibrella sp.]|uniref:DUF4386 domain-containing protein n=1 Tax=uncultured Fibrella sp. TaxID=1284596 RepID=UPI0035CA2CB0